MPYVSAAERALYFFGRPLAGSFIAWLRSNRDLPQGGFLLLPNHITWVDAIVLQLACPRPIRYIIDQEFYQKPVLHPFLRVVGCIPIDTRHPHSAMRAAAKKITEGEIVCLFPEGQLKRAGTLLRLRRGYELIARHANARSFRSGSTGFGARSFPSKAENFSPNGCAANPVSSHGRLRQTARTRSGGHRHRARRITQARRILLQPAAIVWIDILPKNASAA